MDTRRVVLAFGIAATLSGCGGDSGNSAVGYWTGTASNGHTMNVVILDDGQVFGIEWSGRTVYGAFNGTATGDGQSFSASGKSYDLIAHTIGSETLSGTIIERESISASSGKGDTLALTFSPDFDRTPSVAQLAGTYTAFSSTLNYAFSYEITINADGTSRYVEPGCSIDNVFTPSATGRNVFDWTFTITSGSGCAFPEGTVLTGVLYLDTTVTPARQFFIALNADKTDGMVGVGTKK